MIRPETDAAGRTILLVDDEPSVLALEKTILELAGYRVVPAPGPVEALAFAGGVDAHVDLLVTDLGLDGARGTDLARAVRTLHPGAGVLYASGYGASAVRDEEAAFLGKPFTAAELLDKVRAAFN